MQKILKTKTKINETYSNKKKLTNKKAKRT